MAEIATIDEYPVRWRDTYWKVVTTCLVEIFDMESSQALEMASSLRRDLEDKLSPQWQLLIYHNSAINTATTVLNIHDQSSITAAMLKQYEEICERLGWTPEDIEDVGA